jgi:hypothetical protein
VRIQNFIRIEIRNSISLGNAGHQSVRNALSSRDFSKILNMNHVKKIVINKFLSMDVKLILQLSLLEGLDRREVK